MAKTLWIKNKQSSLGEQSILTAQEMLEMVEGLESYSYDRVFLRQPLDRLRYIECGEVGVSSFLFRLSYDGTRSAYRLDLPDFFTEGDWSLASKTAQQLADYLGNPVEGLEDFSLDVYFRQLLQTSLADKTTRFISLQGVFHPVYLDRRLLSDFFESASPIAAFGNLAQKVQREAGHFSEPKFYQTGEQEFRGVYSLAEGVETVLPKEPIVPAEYVEQLVGQEIIWELHLVKVHGEGQDPEDYQAFASIPYESLWDRLPAGKLEQLDANQYAITALTREDLEVLVSP